MKVRVFTAPSCVYCLTLKAFLKERDIEFEEIDVARDEAAQKEMIEKSGQIGVPVIEIGGQMIVGFDRKKIMELLNIND